MKDLDMSIKSVKAQKTSFSSLLKAHFFLGLPESPWQLDIAKSISIDYKWIVVWYSGDVRI